MTADPLHDALDRVDELTALGRLDEAEQLLDAVEGAYWATPIGKLLKEVESLRERHADGEKLDEEELEMLSLQADLEVWAAEGGTEA